MGNKIILCVASDFLFGNPNLLGIQNSQSSVFENLVISLFGERYRSFRSILNEFEENCQGFESEIDEGIGNQ